MKGKIDMKNTIKNIILILTILLILLIAIIVILYKKQPKIVEETGSESTSPEELELNSFVDECNVTNEYFIVKDIVEQYYKYSKQLEVKEDDLDIYKLPLSDEELDQYIKKEIEDKEKFAKETIYNILGKKYIEEFNIKDTDIIEKFKIDSDVKCIIKELYKFENTEETSIYFVKGVIINLDNSKTSDINLEINMNLSKQVYSIYPEEYVKKHGYDKIQVGDKIQDDFETIESNGYNSFEYKHISDLEENVISKELFEKYQYSLQYDLNYAYDTLSNEYKEKKYGNIENYKKYVQSNYKDLIKCKIDKYQVVNNDGNKQYVCLDNYGNYYIFSPKNMCNYNLELDTYTIESDEFKNKYDSSTDKQKAGMNVEKIFEALNTKDYEYIYNHLAETFKNNNYPNLNSFKEYLVKNTYTFTGKEYQEYNISGQLHIFKIKISDKENESQSKNMTVIVNLKENRDFEFSFNIE